MKIISADFVKSAFKPRDFPAEHLPEVAFAGKSNVGKSSLINSLLGRRKLARTSATPGRTQSINFFRINERLFFVDLPGYGFAKVPMEIKLKWKPMVEGYLRDRPQLRLVIVILDSRREPTDDDGDLLRWLSHQRIPVLVVITKVDKITRNQKVQQKTLVKRALELQDHQLVLFSAVSGEGKEELSKRILSHLVDSSEIRP